MADAEIKRRSSRGRIEPAQPASSSLTLVAALAEARLWLAAKIIMGAKAVLSAGAQQTLGPPAPAPFTRFAVVCSPLECECSAPPYRSAASHYFHRVFLAARTTQIATDP
jgi:hypothetical protein